MSEPCCGNCVSWSKDEPPIATGQRRPAGADPAIGICRFTAPVIVMLADIVTSQFPETHCRRICDKWAGNDRIEPEGGKPAGQILPFRSPA